MPGCALSGGSRRSRRRRGWHWQAGNRRRGGAAQREREAEEGGRVGEGISGAFCLGAIQGFLWEGAGFVGFLQATVVKGLQMEIHFLSWVPFTLFICFVPRFRVSCFFGSVTSKFEFLPFLQVYKVCTILEVIFRANRKFHEGSNILFLEILVSIILFS
jgi:hypothetical protein